MKNHLPAQKEYIDKEREQLMGMISHELKTPVTSIKAYCQVLEAFFKKKKDEHSVKMLRKMNKQINKLTVLIEVLMNNPSFESGQLHLKK